MTTISPYTRFFEKQLEMEPISFECPAIPLPAPAQLRRQDASIKRGIARMEADGDYEVAVIDCSLVRLRSYSHMPQHSRRLANLGKHEGNWGAVALKSRNNRVPGYAYAVSAAELLCLAGCVPEGIDRIVCITCDERKLRMLGSHGITILYDESGGGQLLPEEAFSIRLSREGKWWEDSPWLSKPEPALLRRQENFSEDAIGADENGLRLNLVPKDIAAKVYEYYEAQLDELILTAMWADMSSLFPKKKTKLEPARTYNIMSASTVAAMWEAVSCGFGCRDEVLAAMKLAGTMGANDSGLRPSLIWKYEGGRRNLTVPKGEIIMPREFLRDGVERFRRWRSQTSDAVAIWKAAMDSYRLSFSEPAADDDIRSGEQAAYMERIAELMEVKPTMEALFEGVPVEDVLAGFGYESK